LRASGKRAAWPCHVLNVSAEEKNRTFQFQHKVIWFQRNLKHVYIYDACFHITLVFMRLRLVYGCFLIWFNSENNVSCSRKKHWAV
jgi:hypothetical protein